MLVLGWIVLNTVGIVKHWDPYPFILLNLAFSTQAAYAAPLILLAQNRQDDRDRANIDRDREVAARTQADTEYLARELAAVRLALADVVTTEDLDDSLTRMAKLITDARPLPEPRSVAGTQRGQPDVSRFPGELENRACHRAGDGTEWWPCTSTERTWGSVTPRTGPRDGRRGRCRDRASRPRA